MKFSFVTMLGSLPLVFAVVGPSNAQTDSDPFAPLALDRRPLSTQLQTDYRGWADVGVAYVNEANSQFGQYTGLHESGPTLIGNLGWRQWRDDEYWKVDLSDLGLQTRSGQVTWRFADQLKIAFSIDNSLQVRNDSARTPFIGDEILRLPDNWVASNATSGFTALDGNLRGFDRELERQRYDFSMSAAISKNWQADVSFQVENKQGVSDTAGAIYRDASAAQAALLPEPIDQTTTSISFLTGYTGDALLFNVSYQFIDFKNAIDSLVWQNPYVSNLGSDVDYPAGFGALAMAPDNQQHQLRVKGVYQLSPISRVDVDASYASTTQNTSFLDYSVNPNLAVTDPLPRTSFDGQVDTSTFATGLNIRPWRRLELDARYRFENRDNSSPRDGYNYIRGDSSNQPASLMTVYNTTHSRLRQTASLEGHYPLPLRSRLTLGYEFEDTQRSNSAVETTQENRWVAKLRSQPLQNTQVKIEGSFADLAASEYQWDQSYYGLLDTDLINQTPDSQRYITHPALSQYHVANRERSEFKATVNQMLNARWSLSASGFLRSDNYDKTELGLINADMQRVNVDATYIASNVLQITTYIGIDWYQQEQWGRAFRGGQEKDAFVTTPPLPQASDPQRNWQTQLDDEIVNLGVQADWTVNTRLNFQGSYQYVDSLSEQTSRSSGAADLDSEPLPDNSTRLHHIELTGNYLLAPGLILKGEYQFYRFESANWALDNVRADTIANVLSFGAVSPNEKIHYLGASFVYYWE